MGITTLTHITPDAEYEELWLALQQDGKSESSKKIGDLKSSVSELAMNVALGDVLEKNEEPKIMITHHAHRGMARISFQDFQSLVKGIKIEEKLDTPFQGVFPEGNAQLLESDTDKIEIEISILQNKMNTIPVSEEQVKYFKGLIERFRYGMYHFYSAIWSANKGGRQEELNKAIGATNKLFPMLGLKPLGLPRELKARGFKRAEDEEWV